MYVHLPHYYTAVILAALLHMIAVYVKEQLLFHTVCSKVEMPPTVVDFFVACVRGQRLAFQSFC